MLFQFWADVKSPEGTNRYDIIYMILVILLKDEFGNDEEGDVECLFVCLLFFSTGFLLSLFTELAGHHVHPVNCDAATQTLSEDAHGESLGICQFSCLENTWCFDLMLSLLCSGEDADDRAGVHASENQRRPLDVCGGQTHTIQKRDRRTVSGGAQSKGLTPLHFIKWSLSSILLSIPLLFL